MDIFKKVVPGTLWRDVDRQGSALAVAEVGIVPKMTVQEAPSAAVSGLARSTATGSGAGSSGDTAAAAPATAPVASDLPPKLAQAHPDDKRELANLLDKVTDRNTGAKGGTGSAPPKKKTKKKLAKRGRRSHQGGRGG